MGSALAQWVKANHCFGARVLDDATPARARNPGVSAGVLAVSIAKIPLGSSPRASCGGFAFSRPGSVVCSYLRADSEHSLDPVVQGFAAGDLRPQAKQALQQHPNQHNQQLKNRKVGPYNKRNGAKQDCGKRTFYLPIAELAAPLISLYAVWNRPRFRVLQMWSAENIRKTGSRRFGLDQKHDFALLSARRNRLRSTLWPVAFIFVALIFYRWLSGQFPSMCAIKGYRHRLVVSERAHSSGS